MAVLAWLLIPVVAAVCGSLWVSWATRERPGVGDVDGVAGYRRFREAMERPRDGAAGAPLSGRTAGAAAGTQFRTARSEATPYRAVVLGRLRRAAAGVRLPRAGAVGQLPDGAAGSAPQEGAGVSSSQVGGGSVRAAD